MDLALTVTGLCCDLALYPVDAATAARVCQLGENLYKTNSIEWWRANGNNTCGMRLGPDSRVAAALDGALLPLDPSRIARGAVTLTQRELLASPENQVCLLGYDDEICSRTWTWRGVSECHPAKFQFLVQRWDRLLGLADYLVLADVLYDGCCAAAAVWGQSQGFTFREPLVVDMAVVRAECGATEKRAA